MQPFGRGWGEVSGDRLAQIGRQVRFVHGRSPDGNGLVLPNRDVLALVEIAEAARPMANLPWPLSADERQEWIVAQNRLRDALARLDSGAAEENT